MLLRHQLWSFWWECGYQQWRKHGDKLQPHHHLWHNCQDNVLSHCSALCSHSVHLKPKESSFIFWKDFSQKNPQQWSYCTAPHTFQQKRMLAAEADVLRSFPHLCRFWCLHWFLGQLADATFPPLSFTSCSGVSLIRSEELAQGNRFIGKCRLDGVSGGL